MPEIVHMTIIDDKATVLEKMIEIFETENFRDTFVVGGAANLKVTTINPVPFDAEKSSQIDKALKLAEIVLLDIQMGHDSESIRDRVLLAKKQLPFSLIVYTGEVDSETTYKDLFNKGVTLIIEKRPETEEGRSFRNLKLAVAGEVNHIIRQRRQRLKDSLVGKSEYFQGMVMVAPKMKDIGNAISRVSESNVDILITGASGTGKELIARAIHNVGNKKKGPFIPVNCAAIQEGLFESEIFGHEKGAFTSAVATRKGRFELADHGTIFLDEIGDLPINLQPKLLRVLQERTFERVGGQKAIQVDVRLIAATNRNLTKCIRDGKFREDLFYRLSVVSIDIPPLRDRKEEIPSLTLHFTQKYCGKHLRPVFTLLSDTLSYLMRFSWPGNIRELEHHIEKCVVLAKNEDEYNVLLKNINDATQHNSESESLNDLPYDEALTRFEYDLMTVALKKANYNQAEAGRLLGITRQRVRDVSKRLGITIKKAID